MTKKAFFKVLTKKLGLDQEVKNNNSILGTILVSLSGIMLFTDKIFTIELENNHGWQDSETFIWYFCQSVSPMVLVMAALLKPYKISYVIPIYFFFIQLSYVLDSSTIFYDTKLQLRAVGFVVSFILLLFCIQYFSRLFYKKFATLKTNIINLIDFITIDTKRKFINEDQKKEYTKDYIKQIEKLK